MLFPSFSAAFLAASLASSSLDLLSAPELLELVVSEDDLLSPSEEDEPTSSSFTTSSLTSRSSTPTSSSISESYSQSLKHSFSNSSSVMVSALGNSLRTILFNASFNCSSGESSTRGGGGGNDWSTVSIVPGSCFISSSVDFGIYGTSFVAANSSFSSLSA